MINRGSRWLASKATKMFKDPGFIKSADETFKKAQSVDLKKSAMQVGLASTVGVGIAEAEGYIDLDKEDVQGSVATVAKVGAVLAGAAASTVMLGRATRLLKGNVSSAPWKHVKKTMSGGPGASHKEEFVALIDNNFQPNPTQPEKLFSFYSNGVLGKAGSLIEELAYTAPRAVKQFVDPVTSTLSTRFPGLNSRNVKMIDMMDETIQKASSDLRKFTRRPNEKGYRVELNAILQPVKDAVKTVHHKLVNDYSNSGVFNEYFSENNLLRDHVTKYLNPIDYAGLVKQASKMGSIGKQSLDNMINIQGFKTPINKMKYLQLNTKGVKMGDVLNDIQWDGRSKKLFEILEGKGSDIPSMVENMKQTFGAKAVHRIGKDKIQIVMSPTRKSNYDWGGSAGSLIWDVKKPTKIQFFSTDGRDLFGVKLGDDVINVSPMKTISLPEFKKKIEKIELGQKKPRGKDRKPRKLREPHGNRTIGMAEDDITETLNRNIPLAGEDLAHIRKLRDNYRFEEKNLREGLYGAELTTKEKAYFYLNRGAIIGGTTAGLVGAYALATED